MGWDYPLDVIERWYAGKRPGWDWARVVERDGAVVAYIAAKGGYIDDLFVDPGHQGLGLGTALLTALLERGPRPVTLDVFEENRAARRLYERFGLRPTRSRWNHADGAMELVYRLD